jgi:hypothetical protein
VKLDVKKRLKDAPNGKYGVLHCIHAYLHPYLAFWQLAFPF